MVSGVKLGALRRRSGGHRHIHARVCHVIYDSSVIDTISSGAANNYVYKTKPAHRRFSTLLSHNGLVR